MSTATKLHQSKRGGLMKIERKPKEDVKIYVPRKERIKRIQQQVSTMNRVLIAVWWKAGTKAISAKVPVSFLLLSGLLKVMRSFHDSAEGAQRKLCDLEELPSKRDSDNRDAQNHAEQEIAEGQQPSAQEEPGNIQKERNCLAFIPYFLAKRIQWDAGKLEALQADRNADDGDTPHAAG